MIELEKFYSPELACKELGLSRQKLMTLIIREGLRVIKTGKIGWVIKGSELRKLEGLS